VFAGPMARRDSPLATTFWSQVLGLAVGLPFVFVLGATLSAKALLPGAIAGAGAGISLLFLYTSTRHLFVGVASAVSAVVSCVIPVVYSALRTPMSAQEVAGVVLCVLALVGLARWREDGMAAGRPDSLSRKEDGSTERVLGLSLALASGAAMSLYYIALAGTSAHLQVTEALYSRVVASSVMCGIALMTNRSALTPKPSRLAAALPIGAFGILGALSYASAVRSQTLGIIVPVASLSPAVTIALGWLVLRERVSSRQLAGLLLAMAGVLLVSA
jgi:drug/metabolite transporter (DMT)-like permease